MSSTKHTPGPIAYNQRPVAHRYNIENAKGYIIASARDEDTAARMVACVNACEGINPEAVPELYRAAWNFVECIGHSQEPERLQDLIEALKKAEGK